MKISLSKRYVQIVSISLIAVLIYSIGSLYLLHKKAIVRAEQVESSWDARLEERESLIKNYMKKIVETIDISEEEFTKICEEKKGNLYLIRYLDGFIRYVNKEDIGNYWVGQRQKLGDGRETTVAYINLADDRVIMEYLKENLKQQRAVEIIDDELDNEMKLYESSNTFSYAWSYYKFLMKYK